MCFALAGCSGNESSIELPIAQTTQIQINCNGFNYAGMERLVELVFADDVLDMVWVSQKCQRIPCLSEDFQSYMGTPSHEIEYAVFFLENGVGVRTQSHEVLFISDRLKAYYAEWLDQN